MCEVGQDQKVEQTVLSESHCLWRKGATDCSESRASGWTSGHVHGPRRASTGARDRPGRCPRRPRPVRGRDARAGGRSRTGDVTAFAHGMTVATNALLERRGARTALVTTEGFRDVIEIGRQDRPSLYDLAERRPEPLVPRELRFMRAGADGARRRARAARRGQPEGGGRRAARGGGRGRRGLPAVRVPAPRARAARSARRSARRCPTSHVSLSSEVLPEFREYERFSTTVADAYLGPRLARLPRAAGARRGRGGRARRRWSCSPPAAWSTSRRRRPTAAGVRALRAGRRRGRRGARRARERLRGRADLRHGRHQHRRRAGASAARRRRRRSRSSPACRSSCRWSTCTRSAPAAARSPGPTRAARCASGRARRAPTPARRPTARAARSRR